MEVMNVKCPLRYESLKIKFKLFPLTSRYFYENLSVKSYVIVVYPFENFLEKIMDYCFRLCSGLCNGDSFNDN